MKRVKRFIKATVQIREDEDIYKLLNCKKFHVSNFFDSRFKNKAMIWKDDVDEGDEELVHSTHVDHEFFTRIGDDFPLFIDLREAEQLIQKSDSETLAEFKKQVELCILQKK